MRVTKNIKTEPQIENGDITENGVSENSEISENSLESSSCSAASGDWKVTKI